ncbi:MAG: hypothetical protein U5R31_06235 [Acidimicrobiia bacterium]|nr:hypothetical protein [Acidimicrobiia bacterium]
MSLGLGLDGQQELATTGVLEAPAVDREEEHPVAGGPLDRVVGARRFAAGTVETAPPEGRHAEDGDHQHQHQHRDTQPHPATARLHDPESTGPYRIRAVGRLSITSPLREPPPPHPPPRRARAGHRGARLAVAEGADDGDGEAVELDHASTRAAATDDWTSEHVLARALPSPVVTAAAGLEVVEASPFDVGAPQCGYVLDGPGRDRPEVTVGVLRTDTDLRGLTGDAALLYAGARHLPSIGQPAERSEPAIGDGALLISGPITQGLFVLDDGRVLTAFSEDSTPTPSATSPAGSSTASERRRPHPGATATTPPDG